MKYLFLLIFSIPYLSQAEYVKAEKDYGKTATTQEMNYKFISLGGAQFTTVEQVCKPWLSPKGLLVHEKKKNGIIVYDYPTVIQKIRDFLSEAKESFTNIRIEVGHFDTNKNSTQRRGVEWNKKPNSSNITIKGGNFNIPRGVEINANDISSFNSSNTTQFIVTTSGTSASIWTGTSQVDPAWLDAILDHPTVMVNEGGRIVKAGLVDKDIKWAKLGASLKVRPIDLGNGMIKVEVFPEISYKKTKGERTIIKVDKMMTSVVVRQGETVNIGGMISTNRQTYRELFGNAIFKSTNGNGAMNMYLKATIVKPYTRVR